jgi:hypothetical protein
MKKTLISLSAIALFAAAANAQGTTGGGTLQLSGTLQPSIILLFHQNPSNGIQITSGDGSSAAAASLSTVAMYGTANGLLAGTNFTKTQQTDGFTLTGTFNVEVDAANVGESAGYTLTAQLQSLDAAQWSLNGSSVTSSAPLTVTSTGTYATQTPTTLAVKFPASIASGAVGNTINFSATAN